MNTLHLIDTPIMDTKTFDLDQAQISIHPNGIIELFFNRADIEVSHDEVHAIYALLKDELNGKKAYLLVSTIKSAVMTTEARDLASSDSFNAISHADAIIRADYSHEMAANFFIRVNKPNRPVKLFPDRASAEAWLLDMKAQNEA